MFCREKPPPAPKVTSSNVSYRAGAHGVRLNRRTACSTSLLTDVPDSGTRRYSSASNRSLRLMVVRMMHTQTTTASVHHLG
jgi:hypothetical protein